ncbi:MAG: RCC1 domain-containing protein [Deferrisomatales bacterium]
MTTSLRWFGRFLVLAAALLAAAPSPARAALSVVQLFEGLPADYRGEPGEEWQGAGYRVDTYASGTSVRPATRGVRTIDGVTYLCVGWKSGKGNLPASGTASYLDEPVTLTKGSGLTWVYRKPNPVSLGVAALKQTLWGWGEGSMGQVGNGQAGSCDLRVVEPTPLDGAGSAHDWVSVDAAGELTIGVRADGTLWLWGRNEATGQDVCCDGVTCDASPSQVGTDSDWVAAAAGSWFFALAVKNDGTLWAWGDNSSGQLGLGDAGAVAEPTRVGLDADWAAVTGGDGFSLALKRDGTLWAWGANWTGQLGLGHFDDRWTPQRVGSDRDWAAVSAHRSHSLALKKDGTLWAWGSRSDWGLGGLTEFRATPAEVLPGTTWKAIATGQGDSSAAIRSDGTLWTWGAQDDIGRPVGGEAAAAMPGQVGTDTDWVQVSAAGYAYEGAYMLGLKADGSLFAWGGQTWDGQLGLGDGVDAAPEPTQVGTGNDWLTAVAAERHVVALRAPDRVRYELLPHFGTRLLFEGDVTASATATPFGDEAVALSAWTGGFGDAAAEGSAPTASFSPRQASGLTWQYTPGAPVVELTVGVAPGVPAAIAEAPGFAPSLGTHRFAGQPRLSAPAEVVLPGDTPGTEVQWACVGWTGTGVAPSSGSGNTVSGAAFEPTAAIAWVYRAGATTLTAGVNKATWDEAALTVAAPGEVLGSWKAPQDLSATQPSVAVEKDTTVLLSAAFSFPRGGTGADAGVYKCVGITVNTPGYTMPVTKNVNGDRIEFVLSIRQSLNVTVNYSKAAVVRLGEALREPGAAANPSLTWTGDAWKSRVRNLEKGHPADTVDDVFFWDEARKNLYAVRPIPYVEVDWKGLGQWTPYEAVWPAPGQDGVVAGAPTDLQPEGSPYTFQAVHVSESYDYGTWVLQDNTFQPPRKGRSFVRFSDPRNSGAPVFLTVRAVDFAAPATPPGPCTIGTPLSESDHRAPDRRNGYVYGERTLIDGALTEADRGEAAYARDTRRGPIVAVNTDDPDDPADDLLVVWYTRGTSGPVAPLIGWPTFVKQYDCRWPDPAKTIVIAEGNGSGPLPSYQATGKVYHQPDPALPGYNPNEEHALALGGRLYALRDDLNTYQQADGTWVGPLAADAVRTSEPYALLKYKEPATGDWAFDVYRVLATDAGHAFTYAVAAGQGLSAPTPLDLLPSSTRSSVVPGSTAHFEDVKHGHWAKAAGAIVMNWYYPLQEGFYYPDATRTAGASVPFLAYSGGGDGSTPLPVTYTASWPAAAPVLPIGETLTQAKYGLPGVAGMAAVRVIYDELGPDRLAKLIDPLAPRSVLLAKVAAAIATESRGGKVFFPGLPFALRSRLSYDPLAKRLVFQGFAQSGGLGEPLLLPNILSAREKTRLRTLTGGDGPWQTAVDALYTATNTPPAPGAGSAFALTAGAASGEGWVTLAENDDPTLGAAPVALHVVRVGGGPYRGELKVIESDNPFDERLTLRHSGDFGGEPGRFYFKWYYQPDVNGVPPRFPAGDPAAAGWVAFGDEGWGVNDITIEGAGKLTLSDNWFTVRYYYGDAYQSLVADADRGAVTEAPAKPSEQTDPDHLYWSPWAGAPGGQTAQLAEGWIKRVVSELNPLDARVKDFRNYAISTGVSMVGQLGERYEGAIALNGAPENLNNLGLIEAYQTVLDRGAGFSIDVGADYGPANVALLNAATRISEFYSLLGNEAYADAQDPTIGYDSHTGGQGAMASSLFAFRNQLDSLLEEELALLRGRDDSLSTTRAKPVYNRLIWNFTNGEGEVAYVQAYNLSDMDTSGVVDEKDAQEMYPQGHGDAWGHYLTAMTTWYRLLRHPSYTWEPRIEAVLVGGAPVPVDYLDERKFAQAAAAKARAGAEIVNLTYRRSFVADPAGQWQGYKDTDAERAWGVDDWARRAGQGAYFDWVTASAMLPSEDPNPAHTGIQKIDRSTVAELREIPSQYGAIQQQLDAADAGLNPLGLARGVVPFDLDPIYFDPAWGIAGVSHFEQIYTRALTALQNAANAFDFANRYTLLQRGNEDALAEFKWNILVQERDYTNRLIELFGYPYSGDIGAGKTYPAGYDGPDLLHFMYLDTPTLTGVPAASDRVTYTATFAKSTSWLIPFTGFGSVTPASTELAVAYPAVPDAPWIFQAPTTWGQRRAPGSLQRALSELISAQASYRQGLKELDGILAQIRTAKEILEARHSISTDKIWLIDITNGTTAAAKTVATQLGLVKDALNGLGDFAAALGDAISQFVPATNAVATPLPGAHTEVSKPAEGVSRLVGAVANLVAKIAGLGVQAVQDNLNLGADLTQLYRDRMVTVHDARFEVQQMAKELGTRHFEAEAKVLELFALAQTMEQAAGSYRSALAEGERLLNERETYRKYTAGDVQEYRYQDLAFRTFRNDAVQKYRATFDLAARYTYLAATAYDYETNLLGSDTASGRHFLGDIVKRRSPGELAGGVPVAGDSGLSDPLARLGQNFAVYYRQLGLNNPQQEENRFSLRSELFRLKGDVDGDDAWRDELQGAWVPDLGAYPPFVRYCRPFAPSSGGVQPGLVIPFSTEIAFGRNLFGWPLGAGDSALDPSHFTTKIGAAGVSLTGYENAGLSNTPRAYLVPVGADVQRSPTAADFVTRQWRVVDQKLPAPFPLGETEFARSDLIPINDLLSDTFGGIRRFSGFRAHYDSAAFNASDLLMDARLVGRSAWNTQWLLIIPGATLLSDPQAGLDAFIDNVTDIRLVLRTYAYSGN